MKRDAHVAWTPAAAMRIRAIAEQTSLLLTNKNQDIFTDGAKRSFRL